MSETNYCNNCKNKGNKDKCFSCLESIHVHGDTITVPSNFVSKDESLEKEYVIHPDHYNKTGRKECWDEMIDIFGPEAVAVFDVLSAYKYDYRAGSKDGNPSEQDKAKINNYMRHAFSLAMYKDNSDEFTLAKNCWNKMNNILSIEGGDTNG